MNSYAGGLEEADNFKGAKRWAWVEGDIHRRWLAAECSAGNLLRCYPWAIQNSGLGLDILPQLPVRCSPTRAAPAACGWGQMGAGDSSLLCQLCAPAKVEQVPWSDITRWLLSEADFNLPSHCSAFWGRWSNWWTGGSWSLLISLEPGEDNFELL